MNINPIQANLVNTNFGCNSPECKGNCEQHAQVLQNQPQQDVVELSTGQKLKNACKKGVTFVKDNKKGIATTAKCAFEGLLTACTILGANVLMQKVCKSDTSALATKLAAIGGVGVAGAELIRNRKAFNKEVSK